MALFPRLADARRQDQVWPQFRQRASIEPGARPPRYPLQMMIAVFDFPEQSTGDDADAVPEFVVDYLRGYEHQTL